MKFQYRQAVPNAMKKALEAEKKEKDAVKEAQRIRTEKAFHTKICVTCKAPYDNRTSKGICRKCFARIPFYKKERGII